MRFKQTRPQHVRKKPENDDSHGCIGRGTAIATFSLSANWVNYDCVDGDIDIAKLKAHSFTSCSASVLKLHNGNETVMDLGPMLELYSNDKCNESGASPEDHLDDTPPPAAAENNEVIIQGRRPIFSESEESNIASQLKQWKEQGMKYTRLDVVKMASEYAVHLGKRPPGRPLTVKWFRSFLTRHPECYIRKSRKSNKSEHTEKQYFNQLEMILTTYNMKESPHCIFSLVEMPLPMLKNGDIFLNEDLSMNGKGVNGGKPHQRLAFQGKVPSSILFCGSAAGQALPPYLLFAGKTTDKSVLSRLTPGASGITCQSGRATPEVLVSFLREHFLSQAPGRSGDTLVLLLDANFSRCLSQAVIDLGSAFKVVFVMAQTTLNPHLHPMAVGCCNTFHRELCFELQKPQYTSESSSISSASICEFLCRLYHRNMSAENLHSTFRKAGIFPFNPSICKKHYGLATVRQGHKNKNTVAAPVVSCVDDEDMEVNHMDDANDHE